MGLFASADEPDDRTPAKSANPRALVFLVPIAVTLMFPGFVLITAVSSLVHERRRVRARWYLTWAAVTAIIGVIAAGSTTAWMGWNLAFVGSVASRLITTTPDTALGVAAGFAGNLGDAVLAETVAAAPLAFLFTAGIVRYRRQSRDQRGMIEGDLHSNQRPVGTLDRTRNDRERRKIAAGHYLINRLEPDPTDDSNAADEVTAHSRPTRRRTPGRLALTDLPSLRKDQP